MVDFEFCFVLLIGGRASRPRHFEIFWQYSEKFLRCRESAARRTRLFNKEKADVTDIFKLGDFGQILQELGRELGRGK